jgi:hypothetical protein
MPSCRPTPSARIGEPAQTTRPLLLGVELVRADVAAPVLGLVLGDAPCGGPITWALFVDAALIGRTDEVMTDEAAQVWAKRMTGEGTQFQLARSAGGYWLADLADLPDATVPVHPQPGEDGWPS